MTIKFGKGIELPEAVYDRAIDGCRVDSQDCWVWLGASCGKRKHPQIGAISEINGQRKLKVVSVAKLIYVVKHNVFPWQIRRNKRLCQNKLCVNPEHFYAIMEKPKKKVKGERV